MRTKNKKIKYRRICRRVIVETLGLPRFNCFAAFMLASIPTPSSSAALSSPFPFKQRKHKVIGLHAVLIFWNLHAMVLLNVECKLIIIPSRHAIVQYNCLHFRTFHMFPNMSFVKNSNALSSKSHTLLTSYLPLKYLWR